MKVVSAEVNYFLLLQQLLFDFVQELVWPKAPRLASEVLLEEHSLLAPEHSLWLFEQPLLSPTAPRLASPVFLPEGQVWPLDGQVLVSPRAPGAAFSQQALSQSVPHSLTAAGLTWADLSVEEQPRRLADRQRAAIVAWIFIGTNSSCVVS